MGRSVTVRGPTAVKRLKKGLDEAVDAIGATLGPCGRLVIVQAEEGCPPVITKDGVTVARAIDPLDPVERMGAHLVREAAARTNDEAGDGTTTASVLTGALVGHAVRFASAGMERAEIKRGLDDAVVAIGRGLEAAAEDVSSEEALRDIATISANGDASIGALVARAVHAVGADGVVAVENARSSDTTMEVVEGARFDRGYLSPYFVTDKDRMRVAYDDAAVLVTDRKLSSLRDMIPLLEDCRRENRPLLIVAEDVEGEAMQGLVLNRVNAGLKVVAVRLPGLGEQKDAVMHDLVALVGGQQPTASSGRKIEETKLQHLGRAKGFSVDAKTTTIVGRSDAKDRVAARAEELRGQLDDVSLSDEDTKAVRERLARLTSGAAVVRVGGATELELVEKKYRVEDAINAARAALEGGVLPGGGAAIFRVGRGLRQDAEVSAKLAVGDAYAAGWRAALEACDAPLRRIATNAGQSPDVVCQRCAEERSPAVGWDAKRGELTHMRRAGVVDPAKVTLAALRNAASVAGVFLQVDCVVHEPTKLDEEG